MSTREEHYAAGEQALARAEDDKNSPAWRSAYAACAQAHFTAALAAPLVPCPPPAEQAETILQWGS